MYFSLVLQGIFARQRLSTRRRIELTPRSLLLMQRAKQPAGSGEEDKHGVGRRASAGTVAPTMPLSAASETYNHTRRRVGRHGVAERRRGARGEKLAGGPKHQYRHQCSAPLARRRRVVASRRDATRPPTCLQRHRLCVTAPSAAAGQPETSLDNKP